MQSSDVMRLMDAIGDTGAMVLFGLFIFVTYAALLVSILFCGLAMRGAWRWLIGHTWRDAIVAAESHALAGARNKRELYL